MWEWPCLEAGDVVDEHAALQDEGAQRGAVPVREALGGDLVQAAAARALPG